MSNNQSPDELLEAVLATCASYGTLVSPSELDHYLQGFKHSQAYSESKQAIEQLKANWERQARIHLIKQLKGDAEIMPDPDTSKGWLTDGLLDWLDDEEERLAELEQPNPEDIK